MLVIRFLLFVVAASACGRVGFDSQGHPSGDASSDASSACVTPIVLRPTGPGAFSDWTTLVPASGAHVDHVQELVPDEDASYLASNVDGVRDEYAHEPLPVPPSATIEQVTIWVRARSETATTNQEIAGALSLNGVPIHSDRVPTLQYASYDVSFQQDPFGAPWTVETVDAMTFGVRKSYAFSTIRVTQVWAEVTCHE